MSRYIPMPAYPDSMPVDISFVFEDEKPAGKHGFLKAVGEDLRFEDGTLAKFWGVNFNGGACFPDKDYAPKVARRLAMAGCNIVRMHQLDAEWDTPNVFSYSKGKRVTTTRELDPKSMDALDYLIYCLKQEGIYVYLDMMTYRKFKEGDGVVDHELLLDLGKPWCMIDERMIELQKEYATNLWTHYNPYTKLAYKDDPAFVMSEIAAECDFFADVTSNKVDYVPTPYYSNMFRQMFKTWLEEKNIQYDWENCDLYAVDEPLVQFKIEITKKFFRELRDHMRAIGVKIPITGTNWPGKGHGLILSHMEMDYTDSHPYFYDWRWGNTERICKNRSLTSTPITISGIVRNAVVGKPYFLSEWDMPWPNSYRAEGPIYYAALGALQGWSGYCIHTYAYSSRLDKMDVLGRELSSPVAGVPYREGIFSTWNDPAKFGLFYHAALITRRNDVTPANKNVAIKPSDILTASTKALNGALEQHRVRAYYGDEKPAGYDEMILDTDTVPFETPGKIVSDNGQLWRDLGKQIGAVDTPRTKVVYGRLAAGKGVSIVKNAGEGIALNGMNVVGKTDFGVIALSSLTNEPIEKSDNMLLSAIGRARNTDAIFDGEKMLEVGKAPIMAEVIEADVSIKTEIGDKLRVWGVNAEGFYAGKLATKYEDGVLTFHIGDANNPACYYLIVKE